MLTRHRHGIGLGAIVAVLVGTFLVVFLSGSRTGDPSRLHAWLQVLAGSTWPDDWPRVYEHDGFWFALGVAWHVTLNLAPAVGVVWVILELLEVRRSGMQLIDMLKLRDETIKGALFRALFSEMEKNQPDPLSQAQRDLIEATVDQAFTTGARRWAEANLPSLVGTRRAKEILDQKVGEDP